MGARSFALQPGSWCRPPTKVSAAAQLTLDDMQLIIPHQANLRIIQAAARGLEVPIERVMINLERYGNTSTASIPIQFKLSNRGV